MQNWFYLDRNRTVNFIKIFHFVQEFTGLIKEVNPIRYPIKYQNNVTLMAYKAASL